MKKLLIVSILLLSVGLSQNRVNVNNLVPYGDKMFKENDDKPFDGIVFDLSEETGNKILEFRMVNGLVNGLYQEWYPDGKLKRKGKYLNNTQVGDWTVWYEDGQKKWEMTSNMKVTLFDYWYEDGQKRLEIKIEGNKNIGELEQMIEYYYWSFEEKLDSFDTRRYFTDGWGCYQGRLEPRKHQMRRETHSA